MKLLVLFSLLFSGVVYDSALAAQPDNKHSVTSSETIRVSITKTDSVEFVGQSDVLLRQLDTGSNRVTGSTSICITSFSNITNITLAADNDNGFMLTEADSGNRIPYQANLLSAPLNNSAACQHGQYFQLNLTVPESIYNTALSGNYTATLSIIIATE
jgi:hypothetical protein